MKVARRTSRGELSPDSASSYRARLSVFANHVGPTRPAGKLAARHVRSWLDTLGAHAPATRRAYYTTARLFCDALRADRIIRTDPFAGTRPPKDAAQVPRNLTPPAVAAVLDHADQRSRLIAILMLQLGLRRGEVARLHVEDIDTANRVARIAGKGGRERIVPLPAQAIDELQRWMVAERLTSGPLVRSRTNPARGLAPGTVGRILVDTMYKAGVKSHGWDRVSGHSLRHTATADMLRHGAHVRDVQQVLGHVSLTTTQRYMPLAVATLEDAVDGRSY